MMRDAVLLFLGVGGALWCALLVRYAVVQADRDNQDRLAGLMTAFGDRLAALGRKQAAARRV